MTRFIRAPNKGTTSIGIGGKSIEINEDGRFDVYGVDTASVQVLLRRGWTNADHDNDTPPVAPVLPEGEAPVGSTMRLLNEMDAMADDKLLELITLNGGVAVPGTPHEKLVEFAVEITLARRRAQLAGEPDTVPSKDETAQPGDAPKSDETALGTVAPGKAAEPTPPPAPVSKKRGSTFRADNSGGA